MTKPKIVKDTDPKYAKFRKKGKDLKKDSVYIGWFEEAPDYPPNILPNTTDKPQPVAQVAAYNEWDRPMIREMLAKHSDKYRKEMGEIAYDFLCGKTVLFTKLSNFGFDTAQDLRMIIINKTDPPNSEETVKKKGFNDPLIWTTRMLRNAKFKIMKTSQRIIKKS